VFRPDVLVRVPRVVPVGIVNDKAELVFLVGCYWDTGTLGTVTFTGRDSQKQRIRWKPALKVLESVFGSSLGFLLLS
jgi:hypothetical protein